MNDQIWAGVRERVRALAESASGRKVFGSIGHGFALDDPLTPDEVDALEAQIGVALPDEYRTFLLEVGAGGAGPYYGIYPARCQDRWCWEGDGVELADLSRLAEPFPVQGPDPAALRALLDERPEEEDYEQLDDFDGAIEAWEQRWAALMWSADRTVGAVVISTSGCAVRQWLVLSGPERGRIWWDGRVDDEDLEPLRDDEGEPVSFAQWYLGWLADAEQRGAVSSTTTTKAAAPSGAPASTRQVRVRAGAASHLKPTRTRLGTWIENLRRGDSLVVEREDEQSGDWYIQVLLRDDNTYQLEYRDGVAAEHYQTRTVSRERVLNAMAGWASGESAWKSDYMWNNIGADFASSNDRP